MNNIFDKELESLEQKKNILNQGPVDKEVLLKNYTELLDEHHELIKQSMMLTKVSDRLQNKIDKANDKLNVANDKLRSTIEQLDKMQLGKKARNVAFIFFLVTYIFLEGVSDTIIETWADETNIEETFYEIFIEPLYDNWIGDLAQSFYLSLFLKTLAAVIIFAPVQTYIKKRMEQKRKKEIMESSGIKLE